MSQLRRLMPRRPCFGGAVLGLVFWWQALEPTLMPRTFAVQAVLGALCAAIGYGLGNLAGVVGHRILAWRGVTVPATTRRRAWQVLLVVAAVGAVVGPVLWLDWQNDQREVLGMPSLPIVAAVGMLIASAVVTVVLVVLGRLVGSAVRRLYRLLDRRLPSAVATPLTVVLLVILLTWVIWPWLASGFRSSTESSFGLVDGTTTEGTVRPSAATVSGSPASEVEWDSLGRHGRDFVASATSLDDLRAFHGADADVEEPIRVYVGLRSAPTAEARAEMAVRELERTGAFERDVLVVATATGSGWIDPDATKALEQLHRGDTATVSMQYSYLPSWVATLLDPHASGQAGSVLFEAVHARWSELPEPARPKLLVFGLSLGSYGAEAAFAGPTAPASVATMAARTDGVLFVGPTNDNPIWRQLTEGRDAGTPVWQPVFDGGEDVRFANRAPDVGPIDEGWEAPRVLYLQHPTDPVTFWSPSWAWSPPEWQDHPRGVAVPERGRWFPLVTALQGVFDLTAGFGAPPGFGHDYRLDYVAGWAQVDRPDGWTDADTAALEEHLHG